MRQSAPDDGSSDHARTGRQFDFAFAPAARPLLAAAGIVPSTAHVTVTDDEVVARFGPWCCRTPRTNVRDATTTGPYAPIAPSACASRSPTAASPSAPPPPAASASASTSRWAGSCSRVDHLHPGLTVTVADPDGLVAALDDDRRVGD
ncbi:MAG: hypothetical protein R2690_06975 [Acidimicrobiales bacterium]